MGKSSVLYLGGGKRFDWRWDWGAECEEIGAGKNQPGKEGRGQMGKGRSCK